MSVIAQEPNFKALEADPYSNRILRGVLNECVSIAKRQNCSFSKNHIDDVINNMTASYPPADDTEPLDQSLLTTMYQDLLANRPLEFEVYLGNPVRMAEGLGINVPNLQALYAIARHINKARTKPDAARSPQIPQPRQFAAPAPPRQSLQPPPVNGRGRGVGPRSFSDGPQIANGRARPAMNGHQPQQHQRRGSFEGDLDQFRDIVTYGDSIGEDIPSPHMPNGAAPDPYLQPPPSRSRPPPRQSNASDFDLRQRELLLRERELQIRERELEVQRRQGRQRHNIPSTIMDDEEDEDDTRPTNMSQRQLMMGGDNFDMMSMTGRKARKPGSVPIRGKPSFNEGGGGGRLMSLGGRSKGRSPSVISASQATFDPLNENPLMGFTSNRYPGVDTRTLTASSRANSLTSQRMDEIGMGPGAGRTASMMGGGGGGYPTMPGRGPPPGRNGPMPGPPSRGRPQPPMHNSEYGTVPTRGYSEPPVLAPGIPPKDSKVRSTTGSASASSASLGGNGESHSSSSSLEPPLHHGRF